MPSKTLPSDVKITIFSSADLYVHFDDLSADLHVPETEHTWQKIERALLHIQAVTRGGATKFAEFVPLVKDAAGPINNSLLSERTKLSGTAGDLLNSVAPRLAERFEPLVPVFVPTLLLICARTNKVAVKRAEKTLHFIVRHCRPPSVVAYLKEAIKDKGQGLRAVAAGTLEVVLQHTDKEALHRRVPDIEACIKSGATDSNPEVRQTTKRLFELYVSIWPERVEQFTKPMTPTIRRYLSLPKTGALVVQVPPIAAAKPVTRPPIQPSAVSQPARYEAAPVAASHATTSRTVPVYNFFPDLTKPSSSSATSPSAGRIPAAPSFSVNDATYAKRGLFAEQIAAARNARLARVPSFNFDDLPKTSSDLAPALSIKRQPSFEQLRPHTSTTPGVAFRPPRFDVAPSRQELDRARLRSGHAFETAPNMHLHGDINANTPSFAGASGMHGKSALLAAYKHAFASDVLSAKPPSSSASRERHHRDRLDNASKHAEQRREKTVTVRFEPELDDWADDPARASTHAGKAADEIRRSKSAPQIAIHAAVGNEDLPTEATTPTNTNSERQGMLPSRGNDAESKANSRQEAESCAVTDDERPITPPERILHAQTPRTGVKASRVPAQRVAMPSAVKVSAMRVALPTPSAKVAASRVGNGTASVESSPVPKARAEPRTPRAQSAKAELVLPPADVNQAGQASQNEKDVGGKENANEEHKEKPTAVKKAAAPNAQAGKQPAKPASVKPAPSASLAAKARLEARTAKPTTAASTAGMKKVAPKTASAVSKPVVTRKPITASTAASKAAAKPAAPAASSAKISKPAVATKPSITARSAPTSAKPATSTRAPPTTAASSTSQVATKAASASSTVPSRLTASTASTRNKIVPAAAVKKFQPKPATAAVNSLVSKARAKSSIGASLTAKSKLIGAHSAASDKATAVRKASISMAARIEKHRRASAVGVPPLSSAKPGAAASVIVETVASEKADKQEVEKDGPVEGVPDAMAAEEVEQERQPTLAEAAAATPTMEEAADGSDTKDMATPTCDGVSFKSVAEVVQAMEPATGDDDLSALVDDIGAVEAQKEPQWQKGALDKAVPALDTETVRVEIPELRTESVQPASTVATPIKMPNMAGMGASSGVRTPLSAKDPNVPKIAPRCDVTVEKVASPLLSGHAKSEVRTTPAPSPLRLATAARDTVRPPLLETESSMEDEGESDSDMQDETDEVVQLHFRPRPVIKEGVQTSLPASRPNKQLVLDIDSSSDTSRVEANENDETVLLELVA